MLNDRYHIRYRSTLAGLLLALCMSASTTAMADRSIQPLRLALVGGLQLSGVFPQLIGELESATGIPLEISVVGNKARIIPEFIAGKADLLLIHGGRETFALQAEDFGGRMQVWGHNEHVIVGPSSDPAGIRQATDAAAAMRQIATAHAPFVTFRDPGSHEIVQQLWRDAGIVAHQEWIIPDTTLESHAILDLASRYEAYVVVGAIPVAFGKLQGAGLEILYQGDPRMHRAYVALEPGDRHPATPLARHQARKLVDYLISPVGQAALERANTVARGPWIYGRRGAPMRFAAAP